MTRLSPAVQGGAMVRPSRRSHTPGTKPEWNRDLARGDGTWRFTHRSRVPLAAQTCRGRHEGDASHGSQTNLAIIHKACG